MHPDPPTVNHQDLLADMAWLSGLAHRLVSDPGTADDAVQEAWLTATRRSPSASASPSRKSLMHALRGALMHGARGAARRRFHERHAAQPESIRSTAELIEIGEAQQRVWKHLAALEEPFRSTLLLRFHQGLEPGRIAAHQGVKVDTVRWRIRAGLQRLRESVDRGQGGRRAIAPAALAFVHSPSWQAQALPASSALLGAGGLWMTKWTLGAAALLAALIAATLALHSSPDPSGGDLEQSASAALVRPEGSPREPQAEQVTEAVPSAARRVAAAESDAQDPGNPTTECRCSGRVVDAAGRPVTGARVTLWISEQQTIETSTDAAGRFAISSPIQTEGERTLTVHRTASYRSASASFGSGARASHPRLDIPQFDLGDLVVHPAARIVGRLVDLDGEAVKGTVDLQTDGHGSKQETRDGRFEFVGVSPGSAELRIKAARHFPGYLEIRTRAGDTVDVGDVVMEPGLVARGRVLDRFGAPVPSATVHTGQHSVPVELDGSFEIRGSMRNKTVVLATAPEYRTSRSFWCEEGAAAEIVLQHRGEPFRCTLVDSSTGRAVSAGRIFVRERHDPARTPLGSRQWRELESVESDGRRVFHGLGLAGVDEVSAKVDGFDEATAIVGAEGLAGGLQVIELTRTKTRKRSALVTGTVPPALLGGDFGVVRLERLDVLSPPPAADVRESAPAGSARWLRASRPPEGASAADWVRNARILEPRSRNRVHTDRAGRFELRIPSPGLVRAIFEGESPRIAISEAVWIDGEEPVDLGQLVPASLGSIDVALELPASLREGVVLQLNDRPSSRTAAAETNRLRFEDLVPGAYRVSAVRCTDGLVPGDFDRVVDVGSGEERRVVFAPDTSELGLLSFTLLINGKPAPDVFVGLQRGDERLSAYAEIGQFETEAIGVPAGPGYRVTVGRDGILGLNECCELEELLEVAPGQQCIELSIESSRVTCDLPAGWTLPKGVAWQELRFSDATGRRRGSVEASRHLLGHPVASADSKRLSVEFLMVPTWATDLELVALGRGEEPVQRWPLDVELQAGASLRVVID